MLALRRDSRLRKTRVDFSAKPFYDTRLKPPVMGRSERCGEGLIALGTAVAS